MNILLFDLGDAAELPARLCEGSDFELGELSRRRFPDGETYLRFLTSPERRHVALFCSLDDADRQSLPLLLAADAARAHGALSVGLIAPYLAYMRQDKEFHPGEAVTSRSYARLVSDAFDWLITVDPHLHRNPALSAIYSIPALAVSSAQPIADWLKASIPDAVLVGPDDESRQWVERIGELAGLEATVFRKERRGDRSVSISAPDLDRWKGATPVIIDDIASSARTLVEAVKIMRAAGYASPWCVVVHALFAGDAFDALSAAGPARVVSTNTVGHPSNRIDVAPVIREAVRSLVSGDSAGAAGRPAQGE